MKPLVQKFSSNLKKKTGLSFLTHHEMNPIKSRNVKKIDLGVWDQETKFWPLGPRRRIKP